MSGRRSSFLNYWATLSEDVVEIYDRYNNADMTGTTDGAFKFIYDSTFGTIKVEYYDEYDGTKLAESTTDNVTGSEQELTLTEVDSSGVSGTVSINGVSI